jgi:hypothetical protein
VTRVKSRYKQFATGGVVQAEPPAPIAPVASIDIDTSPEGDDASAAFQKQIDALRESERIQKERTTLAAQVEQVSRYVAEHPTMLQNPGIVKLAANEVGNEGHGLEPHSREFFERVKNNFEKRIERLNAPDDFSPKPSAETPKFFEPPEPRGSPSMFSAPVSRSIPGSSPEATEVASGRKASRVTLSVEEKEIARRSGISEADYALGKLELQKRKAGGFYDR